MVLCDLMHVSATKLSYNRNISKGRIAKHLMKLHFYLQGKALSTYKWLHIFHLCLFLYLEKCINSELHREFRVWCKNPAGCGGRWFYT